MPTNQGLPPPPIDNDPPPADAQAKAKSQQYISQSTWGAFKTWLGIQLYNAITYIQMILQNVTNDGTTVTINENVKISGSLNGLPSTPGMAQLMGSGAFTLLNTGQTVGVWATNSTQPGIPSGTFTTITGWGSVAFNPGGGFNGTTGLYTCPESGYYFVAAGSLFNSAAWTSGNQWQNCIVQNGAQIAANNQACVLTGTYFPPCNFVCALVFCKAGDTIGQQAFQSSGASRNLYLSPYIFLGVVRVGG